MTLIATQVKRRRGTTAENDAFTGAEGEITVDLGNKELRVHTGDNKVGGYGLARKDFENITDEAKNISNWSSNVSNCITYIPQDIKLELNNGTLTLKAGSKVYALDGSIYTIPSDITSSYSSSTAHSSWILVSENGTLLDIWTSEPSSDITIGEKWITFNGTNYYLPICIATHKADGTSQTGWKSIDQVFNGFGYIGSTVFALPGVKGLIPNYRNADGSLKNIELTNSSVITTQEAGDKTLVNLVLTTNAIGGNIVYDYDEKTNYCFRNDTGAIYTDRIIIGKISVSSGKITSLTPKTAFHALDYNDKGTIVGWGMPDYTAGVPITTTAQTAPKNGWLIGSLWFSGSNVYFAIDVDGIEIIHSPWASSSWGVLNASIQLKAGQTYRYYGNGTMEQNHLYFYPNNE